MPRAARPAHAGWSPSARREWIEIFPECPPIRRIWSPSARREWIEMGVRRYAVRLAIASPSARREWIEMHIPAADRMSFYGLPPRGGSGLKSSLYRYSGLTVLSPSARREWIEIIFWAACLRRPSASPSARREWIEIRGRAVSCARCRGLPPRGGSGLKLRLLYRGVTPLSSPSARREWIEIRPGAP